MAVKKYEMIDFLNGIRTMVRASCEPSTVEIMIHSVLTCYTTRGAEHAGPNGMSRDMIQSYMGEISHRVSTKSYEDADHLLTMLMQRIEQVGMLGYINLVEGAAETNGESI